MVAAAEDELVARARARIGAVLKGKYRLERLLGVGGMAAVYSATHLRNASRVAVKVLHLEFSTDRDIRGRFVREGYASNVIEHPATVRVADDDVGEDGSPFLVMQLLEGETVDARWERSGRRLGVAEVMGITIDVLDVLAAAHAKGIVWRDGKPENLFLTRDGTLKVLDFGIARLGSASPTKTRSGSIFGTPAYMPPEQARGQVRNVDAQSDVWAVGATAFTLLSGRYVHEGETPEMIVILSATTPAPLLASVAPHVPAPIAAIIDRALAFDKPDRWPSATAMRDALVQAREESLDGALVDDWDLPDDAKTRLAAPPKMTVRDAPLETVPSEVTIDMPTLPKASSVAGMTSSARRLPSRRTLALVATASAGGAVLVALIATLIVAAIGSYRSHPAASPSTQAAVSAVPPASTDLSPGPAASSASVAEPASSAIDVPVAPSSQGVPPRPRPMAASAPPPPPLPAPSPSPKKADPFAP